MRIFDLSLGQMLWSRRSVFLGLVLGGPVLLAAAVRIIVELYARRVPHQRRDGHRVDRLRLDDLAALYPLHRAGPRRLLRHLAHRRRGGRQDDHLSLHAADPAQRRYCSGSIWPIVACTVLLVLPSVILVFFLIVPMAAAVRSPANSRRC